MGSSGGASQVRAGAVQHGLIAESQDPATLLGTSLPVAVGVLHLVRVYVPVAATVTSILAYVTTAGVSLTAAQNLAGLYSVAGSTATKVGTSTDQTTPWGSTGAKTMALTGTVAVTADTDYLVVLLANGVAGPGFRSGDSVLGVNMGLAAPALRYATSGTGLTALPSTINLAGASALAAAYFAALV